MCSTEKDVADRLLERYGVYRRLEERKEKLKETIVKLLDCYKCYHGLEIDHIQIEILQRLIWDIIRMDPVIASFYFSNADKFGSTDLESFGGRVSRKITEKILQEAKTEGLIK